MEKVTTEKRSEILQAAKQLFSERGFDRTTVDEIATLGNVGKGTVYLYFENKEQIFLAILEDGMGEIQRLFKEIQTGAGGFPDKLQQIIQTNLEFIQNNRDFYSLFLKEQMGFRFYSQTQTRETFMSIKNQLQEFMYDFIQAGINEGYLRKESPKYYVWALSGIISHFAFHWIMDRPQEPLTSFEPIVLKLFLDGAIERHQ